MWSGVRARGGRGTQGTAHEAAAGWLREGARLLEVRHCARRGDVRLRPRVDAHASVCHASSAAAATTNVEFVHHSWHVKPANKLGYDKQLLRAQLSANYRYSGCLVCTTVDVIP